MGTAEDGFRGLDGEGVRAALDAVGVTLEDEAEYAEVAVRLAVLLEVIRPLMACLEYEPEALLPPGFSV